MTITNTTRSVTYTGNDITTVFPYTFIIPDADSVVVQLVEIATNDVTVLTPAQYIITGINNPGGGNVTYPTAGSPLAPEFQIQIIRVTVPIQEVSVNNQSAYDADVVEGVWDRLTMMNQDNFNDLERALLAPVGQQGTTVFPGNENETLIYNADGNIVGGPTGDQISSAQGFAQAADASAQAAAASETAAATSETNAANSESAAATSETNAGNSETAAAASAVTAANEADDAETFATAAAATANASIWVSGASYTAIVDNVVSPITFQTYRAKLTHSGETTDPSADFTNWEQLGGSGQPATVGDAFPVSPPPQEGDIHFKTADPVGLYVYYDDGDSQQWVASDSGKLAQPFPNFEEFNDPAGISSWRIIGTTLECWGFIDPISDGNTFNFPKTFAVNPAVNVNYAQAGTGIANPSTVTTTQVTVDIFNVAGTGLTGRRIRWHAIGEWDGIS